jgi:hypothetical protein
MYATNTAALMSNTSVLQGLSPQSLQPVVSGVVQGVSSIVWLAPVPYYATLDGGPVSFTINLWFKAGNTTGGLFQYLFSHMGDPDGSEWGPNQVTANIAAQHDTICTGVMCTRD